MPVLIPNKESILFISSGSRLDKLAFTAVCIAAQKEKVPVTLVETSDARYHQKIQTALINGCKQVMCSAATWINRLTIDEGKAVNCGYSTLPNIWNALGTNIPIDAMAFLFDVEEPSEKHLPSILFGLLFDNMGMIEAANFLAQRLLSDEKYDICRDPDVIDILDPKGW